MIRNEIKKLLTIILIGFISVNCTNPKTKIVYDNTGYLGEKFPNFDFKPNDTIVYKIRENIKSVLPDKYEYFIDTEIQLVGIGDSVLRTVDFKYLTFEWTWIKERDTITISTSETDKVINRDILTNNVLNIEFGAKTAEATNWEGFYQNIIDEIKKVKDEPQENQQCLYEFYNTMFNSNWIRAKVRQVFRFAPDYIENPYQKLEKGAKWTYNLPIEHEAKSLHPIANKCMIDSITDDEIIVNIVGELYGQPTLINPECLNGKMIIDRKVNKMSYFKIEQHMECEEIPSLNHKKYINGSKSKTSDPYRIVELKFDRLAIIEYKLLN